MHGINYETRNLLSKNKHRYFYIMLLLKWKVFFKKRAIYKSCGLVWYKMLVDGATLPHRDSHSHILLHFCYHSSSKYIKITGQIEIELLCMFKYVKLNPLHWSGHCGHHRTPKKCKYNHSKVTDVIILFTKSAYIQHEICNLRDEDVRQIAYPKLPIPSDTRQREWCYYISAGQCQCSWARRCYIEAAAKPRSSKFAPAFNIIKFSELTISRVAHQRSLVVRCLMKLSFIDVRAVVQVVTSQQRQQVAALTQFHRHVETSIVW